MIAGMGADVFAGKVEVGWNVKTWAALIDQVLQTIASAIAPGCSEDLGWTSLVRELTNHAAALRSARLEIFPSPLEF
jgi:hypothetical protein